MRYAERRRLAAGLEDSATGDRERMVVGLCIEIVARRVRCEREALFSHRDVKAVRREQLGERVAVVPSKWRRPRRRTDRVADCLLRGVTASWIAPSGTHALRTMRPAGAVTRAISAAAAGASGAKITPNTDSTTSASPSPRGSLLVGDRQKPLCRIDSSHAGAERRGQQRRVSSAAPDIHDTLALHERRAVQNDASGKQQLRRRVLVVPEAPFQSAGRLRGRRVHQLILTVSLGQERDQRSAGREACTEDRDHRVEPEDLGDGAHRAVVRWVDLLPPASVKK